MGTFKKGGALCKFKYKTFNGVKVGSIWRIKAVRISERHEYRLIKVYKCVYENQNDYTEEFKALDKAAKVRIVSDKNFREDNDLLVETLLKTKDPFNVCYAKHLLNQRK